MRPMRQYLRHCSALLAGGVEFEDSREAASLTFAIREPSFIFAPGPGLPEDFVSSEFVFVNNTFDSTKYHYFVFTIATIVPS